MLAERLLEFARVLKADYTKTGIIPALQKLATDLQNQAGSPGAETYQQAVAESRTAVDKALRASETRRFPPSWRALLVQCRLEEYFGDGLAQRVAAVFARNAITPSVAAAEMDKLAESVEKSLSNIESLISGLGWFEVEGTFLEAGRFEIDISIPRAAIDNELGELGAEFTRLNRIVSFFNELATGSREGAKLIAIGSSDPTAFLHSLPATAAAFAVAVERAVALYGKILEIRKAHAELKKSGVPDVALEGLLSHIDLTIKFGLEEQAKDIETRFFDKFDQGRRAEMSNELRYVLGQLAERIDDGFRFDVRGSAPSKDDPQASEVRAALEVIQKHRPSLISFDATGERILRLSDRRADGEAAAPTAAAS